jgi:predicted ATPase
VLVAVDDVQWLDPASMDALAFSARRLEREAVTFLLARRPGRALGVERALGPRRLEYLEVGPLSFGAVRRLLSERPGLSLPRQLLRRIVESTLGNPLFALELGRTLVDADPPGVG